MIGKGFIKSTIIYSIVGSLPLASGFILLPLFAVHLEMAVYGQFVLYTAFTMLMQIVINLSLDYGLQITYFENKNPTIGLNKKIGTIISSMLIIGSIIILSFAILGPYMFNLYNRIFPSSGLNFYPFGFYSLITAFF
jgi:O-antigen/teichoic acid export membrane protein